MPPLPKKNLILLMKTILQVHTPVYMMKFDIYFTIYTIDILDKVSKNLYILIKKICYPGSSFDTKSN